MVDHDAACCILEDGKVLVNLELERHSRVKHDSGYDEAFIARCLDAAGLTIDDIDYVAANAGPHRPSQRMRDILGRDWNHFPSPIPSTKDAQVVRFAMTVMGRQISAYAVNHHLAHVATAYFTSPFEDAALLSFDGGGDWVNLAMGVARAGRVIRVDRFSVPNLALWWRDLGFNNYGIRPLHAYDPGSGAGKLMALAAYGSPDAGLRHQLQAEIHLDVHRADYAMPGGVAFNDGEDLSDTRAYRSQAVARAIQDLTEEAVSGYLARLRSITPPDIQNLCLSGGVALNCVCNTRVLSRSGFNALHVPPCPNDAGLALGQALAVHHMVLDSPATPGFFSPYTGPRYRVSDALVAGYPRVGTATPWTVASLLAKEGMLCLYRGRSECGPRALGHRSILARPDLPDGRDRLNEIKGREWYRPLAPIILDRAADELLADFVPVSPYMTTSATVKSAWRGRMTAACHVDHSTRPQILGREAEPWIYDMIEAFAEITGIPAVVNTSFNRQEPIVETPEEAVATWRRLGIRHLVLEDHILG